MLFDYFRTRLFTWRIALLWVVCILLSVAPAGAATATEWASIAGMSALLIAQFRLWDDLADRQVDAIVHTQRVIVQCKDLRPCIAALIFSMVLTAVGLAALASPYKLTLYLGLVLFLVVVYSAVLPILKHRRTRVQCVLLKCPVFVFLQNPAQITAWTVCGALAMYIVLSWEE